LVIFLCWIWDHSLWALVGDICMNPSWFFSHWFASKIC
jgi:hypothetical protein